MLPRVSSRREFEQQRPHGFFSARGSFSFLPEENHQSQPKGTNDLYPRTITHLIALIGLLYQRAYSAPQHVRARRVPPRASRVKIHAKSTEARNAEIKMREAYARIEEAGRALRGGGVGADEIPGVPGIGTVENR